MNSIGGLWPPSNVDIFLFVIAAIAGLFIVAFALLSRK